VSPACYEEVGDVANKSARKLRGTGPSGIWPLLIFARTLFCVLLRRESRSQLSTSVVLYAQKASRSSCSGTTIKMWGGDRVAERLSGYTRCKIAVFSKCRFSAQLHCGVPAITSRLPAAFSSNLPSAAAPVVATSSTKQQYTASWPITARFFLTAPPGLVPVPGVHTNFTPHCSISINHKPRRLTPDLTCGPIARPSMWEIDTPARPPVAESLTVAPHLMFPCTFL